MTASWIWARSELRARWRSWVVLGLLVGATFGLAAAGWAGARRTSVTVPRYVAAMHAPTAAVLANDPTFDAADRKAIAALPEVAETYPFEVAIALEDAPVNDGGGLIPTTAATARLMAGVLVEGRMPNPARPDEIVVDQNTRRRFHLGLGATMTLGQSISRQEAASAPPGMIPRGAGDLNFEQKLRVVGISKSVDRETSWAPSSGFYAKYGNRIVGFVNEFTKLRGGAADVPRFQADVNRIVGHPVNTEDFAQLLGIPKITKIVRVVEDGLLLFALAVLIVGGVLIGQALARAVAAGAADLPIWRALGADRRIAVRALIVPAIVTAVVGAVTSVGVAIALSPRFPVAQARRYDLDVGIHADWLVLGLGAVAVFATVFAIAVLSALWALAGRRAAVPSPSAAGKWAARTGLSPALAIGSRLAVEPGRGRRAVPVRSALIGAIVGVLGVIGCFTFRAGLADAASSPQRSGIVWDFVAGSGAGRVSAKNLGAITHDHAVAGAFDALWARAVRIDGVTTPTFGTEVLKGHLNLVVLSGRAPRTRDEIAFGPDTLRSLKVHVGDRIRVGSAPGHMATIVGTALFPATSHTDYDQSAWMTAAGLQASLPPASQVGPANFQEFVLLNWSPGADVRAAQHRLSALGAGSDTYFTSPVELPPAVASLGELRSLPLALGVFFALLATATVAHALVTTVRRRRHELAVLRSLGFTRRQSRIAIAWQSTLLAAAGVVVGLPLGIVGGRIVWRWLAHSFPVVYVPPLALLAVLLVVPAAIAVANALAAWPARSAARIRPAEALRTE